MEVWNEVGLLMLWLGGIGAGLLSILYLEELWATRRPRFARVDPRRTRLLGAWHRWARESPFLAALIAGPFVLAGLAALGIVGAWATVGLSELRLSDDGDVVVIYWSGEISSNDPFPASSIASNNLAPDGGGLSPNNVHLVDVRVLWSADDPASDGEDAAVGDALVLFTTTDGAAFTLWGAHFDGCCFTPPAQLRCLERDPLQPVRLEGFGALTVPGRSGSRWVLLGDVATRGRTGHALAHWAFRSDVRNRGRTTDPRPSTGAGAYEHGFAVDAEVLAGEAVTSYGLVSDGLSGFARYASSIEPAASASPLDPPTQARVPGAAHASRGEAASFASALYTVTDGRLLTRRLDLATLGFDPPQVVATLEPDVVWRPGIGALDGWAFVGTARTAGPRAEGLVALHVPSGAQRVLRPTLPGQVQVDPVDPWAFGADQGLRETVALWAAEDAEGAAGLYAARLDDDGAFAPGGEPRRLSHAASELVPVGGRPYRARLSATGTWLATVYAEARQRGDDRYQTLSAVAYRCPRADAPRPLCFSPPRTLTSARLPVSDLAWPGGSGYRGLQSTPDALALLYEQSDADADRVLIGGLRVEGLDVAPLPPVALLTLAPWPEGEVRLGRNVQSAPDGEALLVVHTQATPARACSQAGSPAGA